MIYYKRSLGKVWSGYMEDMVFERYRKKKCVQTSVLLLFAIGLLQTLCNPVYLWVISDALLQDTALPLILNTLLFVVNLVFYWFAFGALLFLAIRFSLKAAIGYLGGFLGAVVFRYGAQMLSGFFVLGFPTLDDFLYDLRYFLADIALDCVLMAIAVMITVLILRNADPKRLFANALPITKMFDLHNPVLRTVLWLAILPGAVQLFYRLLYDIFFFGAAVGTMDLIWMIVYYVSDIACMAIGYLILILILNHFTLREINAQRRYKE